MGVGCAGLAVAEQSVTSWQALTSSWSASRANLIKERRAMEVVWTTDLFFFLPVGMMLTWLALFVLKLATMLLESTAFIFRLLLLLLLLLTLLLTLRTRVRTPAAKAAKSTAFPPLMMEVLEAAVQVSTLSLW